MNQMEILEITRTRSMTVKRIEKLHWKTNLYVLQCLSFLYKIIDTFCLFQDQLFLPECTPDGRFKRVQCYRSTGYCWCANEDSGKPIPGSSIKDQTPQCDLFSYVRSMPGCPKKNEFLKDLKEFLRSQTFVNSSIIRWDYRKKQKACMKHALKLMSDFW